jgi:serine/threonine-protein kinase
MLERFGGTTGNWIIGERTATACLLRPIEGNELQRVSQLVDRTVLECERANAPGNGYIRFSQGLLAYRQGRFDEAMPILTDTAEKLPNRAGPALVLAMAQFKSGAQMPARKSLAKAIRNFDWSARRADDQAVWISHILRREAESMILPNFGRLFDGKDPPANNDERLALLGALHFENRFGAESRLYADAFAEDPTLPNELNADCFRRIDGAEGAIDRVEAFYAPSRFSAARTAAVAGCGLGNDGARFSKAEQSEFRKQAREWLHAELVEWTTRFKGDSVATREIAASMLIHWESDSALAGIRDKDELDKLPAAEAAECRELWNQVNHALSLRWPGR